MSPEPSVERPRNGPDLKREVSVMVIDDDDDIREVVQAVLEEEGYSVATAANGDMALQELKRTRPKLILLDLTMPGMDGVSFRERQLDDESLAGIPTIVMTARRQAGKDAAPLLVRATLTKPIDLEELLAFVGHYCR